MTIKEFTESTIEQYLEKGGTIHPDITLDIFKFVEANESLLADYNALKKHYPGINQTMGRTIRAHFDLRNHKHIDVAGQCNLIKVYMRFHVKK